MKDEVLGIDLGGTNIRVGQVEGDKIIKTDKVRIASHDSVEATLEQLFGLIDNLIHEGVKGIGMGVPSVVDTARGIVYDVVNIPSWKEVHIKEILEVRYGIQVEVNNDANCFTLGEYHFGKGKGVDNMLGMIMGTGVAGGLIADGRLYEGANCGAGEFGMLPYRDSIFEHYCGGQYFTRQHQKKGEDILASAEAGDSTARKILVEFGQHVGQLVCALMYAYDPELIVLGGAVRHTFPYFEQAMWEEIRGFEFTPAISKLQIKVSELSDVAMLGAASLISK